MIAPMDEPASDGRHARLRLTPIEVDVLRAFAAGMGIDAVADHLGLAPAMVRAHVLSAMAKLGARSKLEAVIAALRAGLIELG
jgi:DNA-binding NarL/FixJ family response regulator